MGEARIGSLPTKDGYMSNGLHFRCLSLLIALLFADGLQAEGWSDFSIRHGGLIRTFQLYVPPGRPLRHMDVVVGLHGGGGKSTTIDEMSGLSGTAQANGFIAVYPHGVGNSWNAGKCCGEAYDNKVDDIGFLRAMLARVAQLIGRQPKVFVTGHSNGGMMAYRMACEMAGEIEAIAPIGASKQIDSCHPSRPVPTLHLHGTSDPCQPYNGGIAGACLTDFLHKAYRIKTSEKPMQVKRLVDFLAQEWIPKMNAAGRWSMPFQKGSSYCYETKGRDLRSVVQYCALDRMGHVWPGGFYAGPCNDDSTSWACYAWKTTFRGPRDGSPFFSSSRPTHDLNANRYLHQFFRRFGLN